MQPAIWANVAEFPPADAAHGEWASWTVTCLFVVVLQVGVSGVSPVTIWDSLPSHVLGCDCFAISLGTVVATRATCLYVFKRSTKSGTSSFGSLNNLSLTNLRKKGQGSLNQVGVHLGSDHSWSVTCLVGWCFIYCYVSPSPRRCSCHRASSCLAWWFWYLDMMILAKFEEKKAWELNTVLQKLITLWYFAWTSPHEL